MKKKHIPYVVLGAKDKPDKGMIAYKMKDMKAYNLVFVELHNDDKYTWGDNFEIKDIDGVYMSIIFANVKSVEAVIQECEKIKRLMENE